MYEGTNKKLYHISQGRFGALWAEIWINATSYCREAQTVATTHRTA